MAVEPDSTGAGNAIGAENATARSPLTNSARGPVPPGDRRTWFVVTRADTPPSAVRTNVGSSVCHRPSTRARVGTADCVNSIEPSGNTLNREDDVPADGTSTARPDRRACAAACATDRSPSATFAAPGPVAAAGGARTAGAVVMTSPASATEAARRLRRELVDLDSTC
ncbi:hypothetical protein ABZ541_25370 [Micromonospora sediminicola]|uniref:hypothetical protein n=1 Tax=Micromonospora sediminicola TaxID=946078 RepID=UPI0033EE7FA5